MTLIDLPKKKKKRENGRGKTIGKSLSKCTMRCCYSGLCQWNFFFLFILSINAFSHVNKCPLFICTRMLRLCLHMHTYIYFNLMVVTSHIDEQRIQSMFILYCSYDITQNIKASVNCVEKNEILYL